MKVYVGFFFDKIISHFTVSYTCMYIIRTLLTIKILQLQVYSLLSYNTDAKNKIYAFEMILSSCNILFHFRQQN